MKLARYVVMMGVLLAAPVGVRVAFADPPDAAKLTQARVDAAAKAYASTTASWKAGRTTIEATCVWSARWLEAAIDGGASERLVTLALADHLARIIDVSKLAQARYKAGLSGADEVDTAAYFLVEAQLWQARGKVH